MEKRKYTVTVAGKPYTLVSSDGPEYVRRIAEYVDRQLRETAAVTNLPSGQTAVLACFNLAEELMKNGFRIVTGGTDNHLMLVDLRSKNLTGKEAQNLLDEVGITANKNTIPFEPLSPFVTSGIRLGSPALTTRGFKEDDMKEVADVIAMTLGNPNDESVREQARARVAALSKKYPLYE